MSIFWTIIGILGLLCWGFSMLAAFLLGQTVMAHAQMQGRDRLLSFLKETWDSLRKGVSNVTD